VTGKGFFTADEPPRPIFRFLLSAFLVFCAYLGTGIFFGIVFRLFGLLPDLYLSLFLVELLLAVVLIALYKLFCGVIDDKPLAFVGLAFHGRWKAELGMGIALGAIMILAIGLLEGVLGVADFSWMLSAAASPRHILIWAVFSLVLFCVAGTAEELSFRGYPFQRLVDSIGPVGAVVVFSALFGLVHLGNRSHTWLSTINTMLVGVTLSVAYLRTRALWLPIGLHVSWNVFQGYALGFPVSGIMLPAALARPEIHGALWLSGGSYGPEGSLLSTGVITLGTVYLLLSKRIYVSNEMRELVLAPIPQPPNRPQPPASADTSASGLTGSTRP
jgi:membrane protease YdiL (CAAX protease family)